MFIRYQTVRNVVLGAVVVVGAGVVYSAMSSNNQRTPHQNHSVLTTPRTAQQPAQTKPPVVTRETATPPVDSSARAQVTAEQVPTSETFEPAPQKAAPRGPTNKPTSKEQLYAKAMAIALRPAGGKGKDVLGPGSPWKLNLYDDDGDGQWDRGKLDTNRDEEDDEKWNFKDGRWEKDGGRTLWLDGNWVDARSTARTTQPRTTPADANLARYRAAMKIATSRADRSGKGKDVLGGSSPWKLNLYDDDGDGQWDRGKLDTNRDEVEDEKWNFKKGRWEKDGGKTIWRDGRWQPAGK